MEFYSYVLRDFNEMNDIPLTLNPWPGGREYAFCLTFNSEGSLDEYQRLFTKLRKWQLEPFFFVNGKVNYEIMDFLKKNDVSLGSNGFSYRNYRNFMYPDAFNDIVENELFWEIDFNGFRFPFTTTGYWGILALLENDYSFTSSIGANNIEFFHGSVFPYNHVISQNKYYKTTEILEVAPIYHDDYHFLKDVKLPELSPLQLNNGVKLYSKYLTNYWNRAVKPYKGLMVYLGHPAYVAYNDTTLSALDSLMLEVAESENTWITSIEEVVKFRNHLSAFNFFVYQNGDEIRLETKGPENIRIDDVSFLLSDTLNVNNASSSVGKASISKNAGKKFLIFDVLDGKVIVLK